MDLLVIFFQIQSRIPIFLKLFKRIEEEETLPSSFTFVLVFVIFFLLLTLSFAYSSVLKLHGNYRAKTCSKSRKEIKRKESRHTTAEGRQITEEQDQGRRKGQELQNSQKTLLTTKWR